MKKTIFLFFFLILLSSFAYAASPFQTSDAGIGMVVESPVIEFVKQNQEGMTLHTHLFNATTGVSLIPGQANCTAHIYNSTGSHILEENLLGDGNGMEWKLDIASGNFSSIGMSSFIIYCNSTSAGGFVRGSFEVTADGEDNTPTDTTTGMIVFLFFIGIIGTLFYLAFNVEFLKEKQPFPVLANFIIKRGLITLGIWFFVLTTTIVMTLSNLANLGVFTELSIIMIFAGWAGYTAMVVLVLSTLMETFGKYKELLKKRRLENE